MKKVLSLVLSVLMITTTLFAVPFTAKALDSSGQIGDNVYYTYDSNTKTVTITGSGDMWDYSIGVNDHSPFFRDRNLTTVVIESGVTNIGTYLFYACSQLSSVSIPEGVTSIGYAAFQGAGLETLTLPGSLKTIDGSAFYSTDLTSLTIPNGVTTIGKQALDSCHQLKKLIIPDSVTEIGEFAFENTGLETIYIPGSVKTLNIYVFQDSEIKTLYLGKGIESIKMGAFYACNSLTDVYYFGSEEEWNAINIDYTNNDALKNATKHFNEQPAELLRIGYTFEMGMYPQTKVTDDATLTALGAIDCTMTNYGYMQNAHAGSHTFDSVDMTYADIAYNGDVYRKVTINEYRPYSTGTSSSNNRQSSNGYTTGNTYYFKWEPIVWQVLAKESDGVYVMSKTLLDSQAYNNYHEDTTWKNCSLRTWLNEGFYEAAFSEDEQAKIVSITHNNEDSPYDTSISGGNPTTDKLWVLSYSDAKNYAYGFSTDPVTDDNARKAQGTDYAKSQGIYVASNGNSKWWLRSPGYSAIIACEVYSNGYSDHYDNVHHTDLGIRPAFKLDLDSTVGKSDPKEIKEDVTEISNYDELRNFANAVNSGQTGLNAVLTADIVATDKDWTPIGNDSNQYTGTFDGDGHKITGLSNENVTNTEYAGLFGYVGTNGVVKNVGLEDGSINGNLYVGGIAGKSEGTIQNCYNTAGINGTSYYVGGIAGDNFGTVQNCYNSSEVNGDTIVGGIVGNNYAPSGGTAEVTNCYNTGTVNGKTKVGGVIGYNGKTVQCCYNTGAVTATNNKASVGGIVGYNFGTSGDTANVISCYNIGAVTGMGRDSYVGGIIGYNNGYNGGTANVTNCYSIGAVTGTDSNAKVGGIIGYLQGETSGKANVTNCCFDRSVVTISGATDENNWKAIGKTEGDTTETNVKGLDTAEMTGTDALTKMGFSDTSVWLVKADGNDDADGKYYWFYPHLKGFDFNTSGEQETAEDITPADWPAKAEIDVTWSGSDTYTYNASEQKPSVTSVKIGGKALDSSEYTVSYYKKTDDSWSTDAVQPEDAGDYKAVITFTADGHANIEKAFTITKADLTITANQQDLTYNGAIQGPGDATYADAAELAEVITVSGLKGNDKVTGVIIDGQGKDIGTYELVPSGATVNGNPAGNNYNVTYVNGVLRINPKTVTITAKSEEFTYDGTAHSCSLYDVEGLVGSDAISAIVEGSITLPSESPVSNVVKSYQFTSGNPNNYTVTTKNGTLTMRKASVPITITSASQEWTYNGSAHSNNGVTLTSGSLFEGDTLSATAAGSVTNVSDTANGNNLIASGYKIMHGTTDVTDNYVITPVNGTLTIKPAAITITADNKESNHGTDLLALTYKIGGNYVDGDSLGISLNSDIDNTKPGTYTITPSWNNNANYTATLVDGTYTVGNSPHYYGTQGDERFTCTVCGEVDDDLKAQAEAADKEAADTAAANAVTDKINALPEADKVTTADEKAIKEAREAYDSLTDDQKAKVAPETVTKLKDAEKALADAKEAEAKAAQEKAEAEFASGVEVKTEKDGATVGWQKVPEAKRYVIYAAYCGKKNKYKKIKTVKGNITSFRIKKLNGKKINTKKNLKVYIVAQKQVNGKWVKLFKTPTFHSAGKNSKYTNVKKIKVKKAKFTLAQGKTAKIKAKLVLVDKKKKPINHVAKFRYMSTNTAVVKVDKNGKLKAIGKGTATVYVFSNNGTAKAVKVTVK